MGTKLSTEIAKQNFFMTTATFSVSVVWFELLYPIIRRFKLGGKEGDIIVRKLIKYVPLAVLTIIASQISAARFTYWFDGRAVVVVR
eukprot:TRINITY_DN10478_c0_g1_i1.p1 TRINITY_DN10478_c0_g1~~TRINITY_DN10478_c0_g1_i1.p1  ORF type:complete len:100 (+),score=15.18 TRINITY_DN10478_c0_g1_i1:41-301(+)